MTKRLALCVGINDYPGSGNDLNGCINDAQDWERLLQSNGYETVTLLDEDATLGLVVSELAGAMRDLRFGDRFVFTYSGHGSWVPDVDGDEPDKRDECLVLYDWQTRGFITDDELYAIYQQRRTGVRVTAFSDSCYSGTVARILPQMQPWGRARYFPAELLSPGLDASTLPPRKSLTTSRPGTVLFSGCSDLEVSYDANYNGRPQGAFSGAAFDAYRPGISMSAWHREIRKRLPSPLYPQTPQLQASGWQRWWRL